MTFKLHIEAEISEIEMEISQLQSRLQKVKDIDSKALKLLQLAKEIAGDMNLVNSWTMDSLAEEVADILDPLKEPEGESSRSDVNAIEKSEARESSPIPKPLEQTADLLKPLPVGTRVKSVYSEMFGTVESFEEMPSGMKFRYEYKVNWDNPSDDVKPTFWDEEIEEAVGAIGPEEKPEQKSEQPAAHQPTIDEALNNVKDEFKNYHPYYIAEGVRAGNIGVVVDRETAGDTLLITLNLDDKKPSESVSVPAKDLLKFGLISKTIYQCSDGRVLLDCNNKKNAIDWQDQLILWGCNCKVIKLSKLWRVEIKGLSNERIEKLTKLHPSVDSPCPESGLGKPLQPGMKCTITNSDKDWNGTEVVLKGESDTQPNSWFVSLPSGGSKLCRDHQLEPIKELALA